MGKFDISITHYVNREEPVGTVYYDNVQWAEIALVNGELNVQLYSHPNQEYWEFPCDEAIKELEYVKTRLAKKFNFRKTLFPISSPEPEVANREGQQALEEILQHPQVRYYANRFGGQDFFEPSGRGARYDSQENFLGFLSVREP